MKLIVGLGNVGFQYKNTRHNLGFLVIDELSKRMNFKYKHEASVTFSILHVDGEKVIFAKPNLFMNNSGKVIKEMMDYFKLSVKDIIVFQDDKDQNIGSIKIINKGGDGGHNGIKDIINHLKTNEFLRVKAGIGSNLNVDTSSYVLGKWDEEQKKIIPIFVKKLANIAQDFLKLNFNELTNKYNEKT